METDSSSSDDESNSIDWGNLGENLSGGAFDALLECYFPGENIDTNGDHIMDNKLSDATVALAYTEKDYDVISETVARLKLADMKNDRSISGFSIEDRDLTNLEYTLGSASDAVETLKTEGVVRFGNILSSAACEALLHDINEKLTVKMSKSEVVQEQEQEEKVKEFGFIHSRAHRWDMYLRNEGIYNEALAHMLNMKQENSDQQGTLRSFFEELFGKNANESKFHEFSSIVCDPGAACQPIHPDTNYTDVAPQYTVFLALQDIDEEMGRTIFLPGTNTEAVHEEYDKHAKSNKYSSTEKERFLAQQKYRQGLLKKGDVAIMDSRTLHCGSENRKSRRVLLYFTLRNPLYSGPVFPEGSKLESLDISLGNFQ